MIWDLHCHLSGVDGRTPHERIAQIMAVADRMQVDRMIFSMGWPFLLNPKPEDLRRQNDQLVEALSHWHHRAFGFVYVSPEYPQESLEEIERLVANGPLIGLKLWVAKRCREEDIDPLVLRATELKALIFQHTWFKSTGNYPGESTPLDLVELAKRHPEMRLICGHTGGEWEQGIRAVRSSPNIFVDTAGFDPTAGVVEMAVRELGADRVLYGSDIGGRSFASQLAKVQGADVPPRAKELILGVNLKRLLTPILADKGVRA